MNYRILFVSFLIVLSACKHSAYQPDGLNKLSDTEIIEKARNKDFPDMQTVIYKTEKGEVISIDTLQANYNSEEWTVDWYADSNGNVKEYVLRKATEEDKILQQKIQEAFEYQPPVEIVEVDCEKKQEILQNVHDSDRSMRKDNGEISQETDKQNLVTIISLIENCGMPTLEEVNEVQMSAIWLVFQHGDNLNRKKYLPLLEQSAENGDLRATQIATMKDRILMMDGEPQIYGSQIIKDGDEWILYELANPETVNKRRAEIGFEPLQDYLKKWNIAFTVEQTN